MQEVNNTLPYDAQALPDIASALRSGEEEPKKVQEPLPEVPKGPLTVSEAYAFLGVPEADRGQLEKVKARFRKLSLKYHPDKNLGREEAAAEVFQAVHAAYHTLTTNNFDYERWAQAFTVQSSNPNPNPHPHPNPAPSPSPNPNHGRRRSRYLRCRRSRRC